MGIEMISVWSKRQVHKSMSREVRTMRHTACERLEMVVGGAALSLCPLPAAAMLRAGIELLGLQMQQKPGARTFKIRLSNDSPGTSLVVHWLRIHLPRQGTQFDPWSGKIPHALGQLSREL